VAVGRLIRLKDGQDILERAGKPLGVVPQLQAARARMSDRQEKPWHDYCRGLRFRERLILPNTSP